LTKVRLALSPSHAGQSDQRVARIEQLAPPASRNASRLLGRRKMHTPSKWTFWLSVALVVLAIISAIVHIPFISAYALWVAVIGYVVLVIGVWVKTA
jgi:hypothetical protein